MSGILYIVIPCYNEQEVLPTTSKIFLETLDELINTKKVNDKSKILFVNDGSKDDTWNIIKQLAQSSDKFLGISQSRNRGHQSAILAGMQEAIKKADMVVTIDCDGQDDVSTIIKMVEEYNKGYDIVYGVRNNRDTDSFFKRTTAQLFYTFIKFLGADVVYNHADFRLLSKRALEAFLLYKESNLFIRGIIPLVGYKYTKVFYRRTERIAGKTHYNLARMTKLAIDGITSLSVKPIRIITIMGLFVSFLSFLFVIYVFVGYMLNQTISGWASLIITMTFLGGVQLISLGIIGEYIGKIYIETKARPRVIISEKTYEDQ